MATRFHEITRRVSSMCVCIALMFFPLAGSADQSADFSQFKAWLKQDGWAYHVSVQSAMKMQPAQKKVQNYEIYTSNEEYVRYASGDDLSFFMNRKGMYQINHDEKVVLYKQFSADSIWQQLQKNMDAMLPKSIADSFFFRNASIAYKSHDKAKIQFELSYPRESPVKRMLIDFEPSSKKVSRIEYTIERAMNGSSLPEAMVIQKVVMDKYTRVKPEKLQRIISLSSNLKLFLDTAFTGYTIYKM